MIYDIDDLFIIFYSKNYVELINSRFYIVLFCSFELFIVFNNIFF